MLVLLILVFILFAHWFACIWYSIGNTELNSGVTYGWLQTLAAVTKEPFVPSNTSATSDYTKGPTTEMRYLTALYFTLSCMTGVGFGNVSANTQTEKLFSVFMMIIGCKLFPCFLLLLRLFLFCHSKKKETTQLPFCSFPFCSFPFCSLYHELFAAAPPPHPPFFLIFLFFSLSLFLLLFFSFSLISFLMVFKIFTAMN